MPAPRRSSRPLLRLGAQAALATLLASCSVGSPPQLPTLPSLPALLTPPAAASPPPFEAHCGLADFRGPAQAVAKLNAYRAAGARCGTAGSFGPAPALTWSPALATVAQAQSRDMAERGVLEHRSASGRDLAQRLAATGVTPSFAAENIAHGQDSLTLVMSGWLGSAGHCANMMAAQATTVALACHRATDGSTWWTLVTARLP